MINSNKDRHVFISYSKLDSDVAVKLCNDIKNIGIDVWIDSEQLLPGQNWKSEIRKAIKNSSYFIALFSSNSVSQRGYIHKEIKLALDILDELPQSNIFIIPIRIDSCRISDERLSEIQIVDLFPSYKNALDRIFAVLQYKNPHKKSSKYYLQSNIINNDNVKKKSYMPNICIYIFLLFCIIIALFSFLYIPNHLSTLSLEISTYVEIYRHNSWIAIDPRIDNTIKNGDQVQLRIKPNKKSYLYIFLYSEGDKTFQCLFPRIKDDYRNKIVGSNNEVVLPEEERFFKVFGNPGLERFIIIASKTNNDQISKLSEAFQEKKVVEYNTTLNLIVRGMGFEETAKGNISFRNHKLGDKHYEFLLETLKGASAYWRIIDFDHI